MAEKGLEVFAALPFVALVLRRLLGQITGGLDLQVLDDLVLGLFERLGRFSGEFLRAGDDAAEFRLGRVDPLERREFVHVFLLRFQRAFRLVSGRLGETENRGAQRQIRRVDFQLAVAVFLFGLFRRFPADHLVSGRPASDIHGLGIFRIGLLGFLFRVGQFLERLGDVVLNGALQLFDLVFAPAFFDVGLDGFERLERAFLRRILVVDAAIDFVLGLQFRVGRGLDVGEDLVVFVREGFHRKRRRRHVDVFVLHAALISDDGLRRTPLMSAIRRQLGSIFDKIVALENLDNGCGRFLCFSAVFDGTVCGSETSIESCRF